MIFKPLVYLDRPPKLVVVKVNLRSENRRSGYGLSSEEFILRYHTVDYAPFIKSQLARTHSTLRPCVVHIWSRTTPESGVNETLVVHRVAPARDEVEGVGGEEACFRLWGLGFRI